MKMRRRTGVNGVRENHRDTVVIQGGTAESFGPLSGRKARLFYEKIQGRILPRRNKNREERRETGSRSTGYSSREGRGGRI